MSISRLLLRARNRNDVARPGQQEEAQYHADSDSNESSRSAGHSDKSAEDITVDEGEALERYEKYKRNVPGPSFTSLANRWNQQEEISKFEAFRRAWNDQDDNVRISLADYMPRNSSEIEWTKVKAEWAQDKLPRSWYKILCSFVVWLMGDFTFRSSAPVSPQGEVDRDTKKAIAFRDAHARSERGPDSAVALVRWQPPDKSETSNKTSWGTMLKKLIADLVASFKERVYRMVDELFYEAEHPYRAEPSPTSTSSSLIDEELSKVLAEGEESALIEDGHNQKPRYTSSPRSMTPSHSSRLSVSSSSTDQSLASMREVNPMPIPDDAELDNSEYYARLAEEKLNECSVARIFGSVDGFLAWAWNFCKTALLIVLGLVIGVRLV
ncbi:MAG: hypothetical protein MMC23_005450 [Stictis urceolatum]|nr:hypothetical protein [Stictis urceolata]